MTAKPKASTISRPDFDTSVVVTCDAATAQYALDEAVSARIYSEEDGEARTSWRTQARQALERVQHDPRNRITTDAGLPQFEVTLTQTGWAVRDA